MREIRFHALTLRRRLLASQLSRGFSAPARAASPRADHGRTSPPGILAAALHQSLLHEQE
jgi:hypothetical protein